MKIASYNSHRSAPFPRALVVKNNQVYSLEGSRRRYPISVPAGILRALFFLGATLAGGLAVTIGRFIFGFRPGSDWGIGRLLRSQDARKDVCATLLACERRPVQFLPGRLW